MEIHRLLCPVLIGDGIVVVENRREGAEAGEHIACHDLRVGIEIGDHHVALSQRAGELHPALLEYGIIGIIPAVFCVKITAAVLQCVQFYRTDGIVQCAEGLAAGPVIELSGSIVKALPCGKVCVTDAGGLRKAGEAAAVAHQKLGGFGNREEQQGSVLRHAVGQKAGDKVRELLCCKPGVPIYQIVRAQRRGVADVAGEQIGHFRCVSAALLGFLEEAADLGGTAEIGHLYPDALLLPHGTVEFLHQQIHRRAGLLAVNVPEVQRHRVALPEQGLLSAAGEGKHKGGYQQQGKQTLFHGKPSKIEKLFINQRYF